MNENNEYPRRKWVGRAGMVAGALMGYYVIGPSISEHKELFGGLSDIAANYQKTSDLLSALILSGLSKHVFGVIGEKRDDYIFNRDKEKNRQERLRALNSSDADYR